MLSLEGLPAAFEGEFDVGVRIGRLRDPSLIARKIAPIRLAVCAAPAPLGQGLRIFWSPASTANRCGTARDVRARRAEQSRAQDPLLTT